MYGSDWPSVFLFSLHFRIHITIKKDMYKIKVASTSYLVVAAYAASGATEQQLLSRVSGTLFDLKCTGSLSPQNSETGNIFLHSCIFECHEYPYYLYMVVRKATIRAFRHITG